LERRAKWHYLLNQGFVPILETNRDGRKITLFESRIIMDYLETAYERDGFRLYSESPETRAMQHLMMKKFDELASVLFEVIMSHAKSE
jgi:glutathione S-transferase